MDTEMCVRVYRKKVYHKMEELKNRLSFIDVARLTMQIDVNATEKKKQEKKKKKKKKERTQQWQHAVHHRLHARRPLPLERRTTVGTEDYCWNGGLCNCWKGGLLLEGRTTVGREDYCWNGGLLLERMTTVGTEDYCWKGGLLLERRTTVRREQLCLPTLNCFEKRWCTLEYVTVVSHVITITERH